MAANHDVKGSIAAYDTLMQLVPDDAAKAAVLIEEYRVTHAQFVPTMFVRLLKLDPVLRSRYDISSLQCAIHAAAPLSTTNRAPVSEPTSPVDSSTCS